VLVLDFGAWAWAGPIYRGFALAAGGDRDGVERLHQEIASFGDPNAPQATVGIWAAGLANADGRFGEAKAAIARYRTAADSTTLSSPFIVAQGQLTVSRVEQGRGADVARGMLPLLGSIPSLVAWRAMAAGVLADAGEVDEARVQLGRVLDAGLPDDWNEPLGLRWLAEMAATLEDTDLAAEIRPRLAPFSGQLLVVANLVSIEGAADRGLGQLALVEGRLDDAVRHLDAAVALERGFRAPALAARSSYWLARALAARHADGDRKRAHELVADVVAETDRMGMSMLHDQAARLLADVSR
jgi:tetratricopeptide (TPR) repeat protein